MLSGCAAVAPRLPAPLPERAITVGGYVGGGGGGIGSSAYLLPYGLGFGGASIAWQVMRTNDLALELDGGVGLGGSTLPGASPFLGAHAGARGWYLQRDFALGVDAGASAMVGSMESQSSFQGGGTTVLSIVDTELRALAALRVADGVWLGTRPGVLVLWSSATGEPTPIPDLPLAVSWDVGQFRLGVEAGWVVPYGGRGGASFGLSF